MNRPKIDRMKPQATFTKRKCPYCNAASAEQLFNLKAAEICKANWTYSREFRSILGLEDNACFPINRCLSCGFVYAALLPCDDFLNNLYNKVIDTQLAERGSKDGQDYARRLGYISQIVRLGSGFDEIKAFDFGAGFGVSSGLLNLIDKDVVAYDPNQTRSDRVTRSGVKTVGDLADIRQFVPFNMIICDNVLEHVPDVRGIVQLFADLIEDQGILYISVPSYERRFIDKLLTDYSSGRLLEVTLNPWEHLNYFDLSHLDSLLGDYGFQPLRKSELSGPPDVGLRPEVLLLPRWKNGLASIFRLLEYLVQGTTNESVNDRFYRFSGGKA